MATKTKIKDNDKTKTIFAELAVLNSSTLAVGVIGHAAKWSPGNGGANMADIATFNEYGTRAIPARPFIRTAIDENAASYEKMIKKGLGYLVKPGGAVTLLNRLSLKTVADVQRKIVTIKTPPNAASTIKAKKSSNPLIDTGRLRQSISAEIRPKS